MEQDNKVRTTIVLEGIDQAILDQVEKDFGLSRSAAVRYIIRRWGRVDSAQEEAPVQQAC